MLLLCFFWLHLFSYVYLAVLLSPASPSPSFLSAAVCSATDVALASPPFWLLPCLLPWFDVRCRLLPSYFSFAHSPALCYEGVVISWFSSLLGFPVVRCKFLLRWFAFRLRFLFLSLAVFPVVLIPTFRFSFCLRFLITSAL